MVSVLTGTSGGVVFSMRAFPYSHAISSSTAQNLYLSTALLLDWNHPKCVLSLLCPNPVGSRVDLKETSYPELVFKHYSNTQEFFFNFNGIKWYLKLKACVPVRNCDRVTLDRSIVAQCHSYPTLFVENSDINIARLFYPTFVENIFIYYKSSLFSWGERKQRPY